MMVYIKVPRSEAQMKGSSVIANKWLDINKGDGTNPNIRCHLVGRELKLDNGLDIFAATPPLESLKVICSICASNQNRKGPCRILTVDVPRAYFYAKVMRLVYMEFLREDLVHGVKLNAARLNLHLHGTRDARQNWAAKYSGYLSEVGGATPCSFKHAACELFVTVHGDDFTITCPEADLKWMEAQMAAKYEIKSQYLGPDPGQAREVRLFNRTSRWT